jgi:hypothetical protein
MLTSKIAHAVALAAVVAAQRSSIKEQLTNAIEASVKEAAASGKFLVEVQLYHDRDSVSLVAGVCTAFRERGFEVSGYAENEQTVSTLRLEW